MKKTIKKFAAITLMTAMSVSAVMPVWANESEEIYRTSKTSIITGQPVISTFTDKGGLAKALDLIINHEAEFETVGNSTISERIHAWTTCNLNNSAFTPVDSYTRAYYENPATGTIYEDSGRRWDSDDGGVEGFSEAYSGWFDIDTFKTAVGKSFYGTQP